MARGFDLPRAWSATLAALVLSFAIACSAGVSGASAAPGSLSTVYATGRIVPIPASVPHEAGDMVDSRIVPDLVWIAQNFPIYVTDGYSGPLPSGRHVGCDDCHVGHSDHLNGLAVDIVPLDDTPRCDSHWRPITRLAKWAEPVQNHPVAPFRWVGYDGDAGHGCGNHLHLSWDHAPAAPFALAQWVDVFGTAPTGGDRASKRAEPVSPQRHLPSGGFEPAQIGGISSSGD